LSIKWTLIWRRQCDNHKGLELALEAAAMSESKFALIGILGKGKTLFETGAASIQKSSFGVLDNFVAAAMRCPQAHVEVSGRTDEIRRIEFQV
jgi:outer membrane protein OmpA-like peptidoglycan-associated protein